MAVCKALIFDVDGTLAETEELHRKAFNQTFQYYGLNWHWDKVLYGRLLGVAGGRNRLLHFIETEQPDCAGDFVDRTAEMHQRKTVLYGQMIAKGDLQLRPGIAEIIESAIAQGLKLGIVTSTSRKNVDVLFAATMGMDVLKKFTTICCGDEVSRVKPDPEVYLMALQQLNLDAVQCLAFEDSRIGLTSALAANIATIITYSSYTRGEDFTGAKLVMKDLVSGKFDLAASL